MASEELHERAEDLTPSIRDSHRAIVSLMEELEAVDWYNQRAAAAHDGELRDILKHNRDEEKEHAAMLLEWLRRRDDSFDEYVRTYLFTDAPLTKIEKSGDAAHAEDPRDGAPDSLGIGSLNGVPQQ